MSSLKIEYFEDSAQPFWRNALYYRETTGKKELKKAKCHIVAINSIVQDDVEELKKFVQPLALPKEHKKIVLRIIANAYKISRDVGLTLKKFNPKKQLIIVDDLQKLFKFPKTKLVMLNKECYKNRIKGTRVDNFIFLDLAKLNSNAEFVHYFFHEYIHYQAAKQLIWFLEKDDFGPSLLKQSEGFTTRQRGGNYYWALNEGVVEFLNVYLRTHCFKQAITTDEYGRFSYEPETTYVRDLMKDASGHFDKQKIRDLISAYQKNDLSIWTKLIPDKTLRTHLALSKSSQETFAILKKFPDSRWQGQALCELCTF